MRASAELVRRTWIQTILLALVASGYVIAAHSEEQARVAPMATAATRPIWIPTGSLGQPRLFHTATLLGNGKVLVAGGIGVAGAVASAELYDPVSGTWSATGSMSMPRVGHTVTLLASGKALATGGELDTLRGAVGTAEIYDPATGSWSPTGKLMTARSSHTGTLLQNGKVLVVGGINWSTDVVGSAELFDPATGTWSQTGSPIQARFSHTATLLNDGRVLVARGAVDNDWETAVSSAELYDPATGTWIPVASGGGATVLHTATLLPSGKVLVAGGGPSPVFTPKPGSLAMSELFDPATLSWARTGDLGTPRYLHTAALLPTGEVLVTGGTNATYRSTSGYSYDAVASAEKYDPKTGTWSSVGDLGAPRSAHSATLLPDGKVLVAGGGIGSPLILASAELYRSVPAGTIVPAFTGSWYDPEQMGHGLVLEVLPDSRFLAAWFAFNPAGTEQAWFLGTGSYSGNTATINSVVQPTGGRFVPNFDPARVVNNAWGTLTFTFTDCNHGRVDFSSTRGYGTGSMNLTRLTQPAGLSC
jgi:N-acetylneuraminic acid mutarotase